MSNNPGDSAESLAKELIALRAQVAALTKDNEHYRVENGRLREALLACVRELETWPKSLALRHGSLKQAYTALEETDETS